MIQAWLRGLQAKPDKPPSAAHIRLVHGTLSTILTAAVVDERIAKNPAKAETVKPPKPDKRRVIPWEASRVAAIRAGMPYRYQALAGAGSGAGSGAGLRQGEVFGLSPRRHRLAAEGHPRPQAGADRRRPAGVRAAEGR